MLMVVLSVSANSYAEQQCIHGINRQPVAPIKYETCPHWGNVNGIKIAIPGKYLSESIWYTKIPEPGGYPTDCFGECPEGWRVSRGMVERRFDLGAFEDAIDWFSIRIRQSNFMPISTLADRNDYIESVKAYPPSPENRWLEVVFDAREYIKMDGQLKFDGIFEYHPKRSDRAADIFGLMHYTYSRPNILPLNVRDPRPFHVDELMYDRLPPATVITCHSVISPQPSEHLASICSLSFPVDEIKAFARILFKSPKEDLAQWREIESEIRRLVHSFVVP